MTTTRTPAADRFQPIDPQPDDAPPMPNQTDKTLAQIRSELLTTFSAADWESYNHLVGWLRDTDVASHALKVGDAAPDFLLPLPQSLAGAHALAIRGTPLGAGRVAPAQSVNPQGETR
jgi:hypothetical protein